MPDHARRGGPRITREQLQKLGSLAKVRGGVAPLASGVAASGGVASGVNLLDPYRVAALAEAGQNVILVRARPPVRMTCMAW
jgi:hypothetical protein